MAGLLHYCIDSSSIFAAWNERYWPEAFPTFWRHVDDLVKVGRLFAPEEVRDIELRQPAELRAWADARDGMFRDLDDENYQTTITEVVDKLRAELRKRRLALRPTDFKADPFVVALARVEGAVVVNEENLAREANARPKIPNLCGWYGVRSINLRDFIREQGWTF